VSDEECAVAVVGGGPAGCSAAVFAARFGLDVAVFDRGPSSLARCAHLGNYLGFPGGIDVETFTELMHAYVEACGGAVRSRTIESVRSIASSGPTSTTRLSSAGARTHTGASRRRSTTGHCWRRWTTTGSGSTYKESDPLADGES